MFSDQADGVAWGAEFLEVEGVVGMLDPEGGGGSASEGEGGLDLEVAEGVWVGEGLGELVEGDGGGVSDGPV